MNTKDMLIKTLQMSKDPTKALTKIRENRVRIIDSAIQLFEGYLEELDKGVSFSEEEVEVLVGSTKSLMESFRKGEESYRKVVLDMSELLMKLSKAQALADKVLLSVEK